MTEKEETNREQFVLLKYLTHNLLGSSTEIMDCSLPCGDTVVLYAIL